MSSPSLIPRTSTQTLNYVDSCTNFETYFTHFQQDKEKIIKTIYKNADSLVKLWPKVIPKDNCCQVCMGQGNWISNYCCFSCSNIRRLLGLETPQFKNAFKIENPCIVSNGLLAFRRYVFPKIFLNYDEKATVRGKIFLNSHREYTMCGTPANVSKVYSGDIFSIAALSNFCIEDLCRKHKLPHYQNRYTNFICGQHAYTLENFSNIQSISDLANLEPSIEDFESIIKQLIIFSKVLGNIYFSHGQPKNTSLVFDKTEVYYNYDGINVNGNYCLKLDNLNYSSFMINGNQFMAENSTFLLNIDNRILNKTIKTLTVPKVECIISGDTDSCRDDDNVNFFRLSDEILKIYDNIRHSGFPLFSKSFDFYNWLIIFANQPLFYEYFQKSPLLKNIWEVCWHKDELEKVHNIITKDDIDYDHQILKLWLRCDVVDTLYELLK